MIRLLFVSQILFGVLAFALPSPLTFAAGDVAKAKPKHYVDGLPGNSRIGAHPLIVMTDPDKDGFVRVASITHDHPSNTPTRHPQDFGIHIEQADPNRSSGTIGVAAPHRIHVSHITPGKLPSTMRMEPHHFEALKAEMRKNCGNHVLRRADQPQPEHQPEHQPDPCDHVAQEHAAAKAWRWSPKRAANVGFNPQDRKNWWKTKKTPANQGTSSSSTGAGGSQAQGGNHHPSQEQSKGKGKSRARSINRSSAGRKSKSPSSRSRSPSPKHKASSAKTVGGSGSAHHVNTQK